MARRGVRAEIDHRPKEPGPASAVSSARRDSSPPRRPPAKSDLVAILGDGGGEAGYAAVVSMGRLALGSFFGEGQRHSPRLPSSPTPSAAP